ncbi:hypothetical protein COW46_00945 [Candidatus Gracilibacteria bacterium CG17_big_fil_post_rev_8_21_14_2_50_48_13]|nr:MAG: hypothetical protein COW46_00945 [Candidatus Gracilibacteria bacterium CG17_big_fil_post_rev_8_21_14_2_50_48_13]
MKIEKRDGDYLITPDDTEDPKRVLAAIARASIEYAGPRGMSHLSNQDFSLSWSEAERFVQLDDFTEPALYLDYAGPGLCKTKIMQREPNTFTMYGYMFERDRGNPIPMFERAQELLDDEKKPSMVDPRRMQRGEGLDMLLSSYDLVRKEKESDWEFLKRVFPALFKYEPELSFQILMGMNPKNWTEANKALVLFLAMSEGNVSEWINGFPGDPIGL